MILLLLLSTILVTSNGSLMSDDDYSIWDNLNLLQDDKDYVFPIEDSKEQESLETGFIDDINLSTIEQEHGSPNSVIRSATFDCGPSSTEEPDYMDYDESLRINKATSSRGLDKTLLCGLLIFGLLLWHLPYFRIFLYNFM